MKILVTGALGFLGSRLALRLARAGHEVTALDNGFRGAADLSDEVALVEADVRDANAVRAEMECAARTFPVVRSMRRRSRRSVVSSTA